ncbi:hypothetical protein [Mesobacterium pallidum]|uniref:hypothetical protein n=1 Tax=Mesobacterium pallidum TaxID=2872037 RepID=UPI001EE37122|nr:hypothetical protein [Mesobacterium pallidum]
MKDLIIKEITELETKLTSATGEELAALKARLAELQGKLAAQSTDDGEDSSFDNMPV